MEINVKTDTARGLERLHLRNHTLVFGSIVGSKALECLRAWAGGCSTSSCPLVRPVAVVVAADAGRAAYRLAVLAPESIRGLGVDKAFDMLTWQPSGGKFITHHQGLQ